MFKKLSILCGVLMALCLSAQAQVPTGFVKVYQNALTDANGVAVSNATVCAQGMVSGRPISVQVGNGSGTGIGSTVTRQVCAPVNSGVWSMYLPDGSMSSPLNPTFQITIVDNVSGDQIGQYSAAQPTSVSNSWCGASGCSVDALNPDLPVAPLQGSTGGRGPAGPPGCAIGVISSAGCGTSLTPQALGNVLYADAFPGNDICAKVTAAFASVAGSAAAPTASATVVLSPGNHYTCSTALVYPNAVSYPYIMTPNWNLNGSDITFTSASAVPMTIPARNGGNNGSGSITNGHLIFATPGSELRFESATYFTMKGMTLTFIGNTNGFDWVNVTSPAFGGGGYFEDNDIEIQQADSPVGGCFMTLRQDPTLTGGTSTGSFFYDRVKFIHYSGNSPTSKGMCVQSPPAGIPAPVLYGWRFDSNQNGDGTLIDLANGTTMTRGTVNITGEGTPTSYAVAVHGNATFNMRGSNLSAPGWGTFYDTGTFEDQIKVEASIPASGKVWAFPYSGSQSWSYEVNNSNRENMARAISNQSFTMIGLPNPESFCSGVDIAGNTAPWYQFGTQATRFGLGVFDNDTNTGFDNNYHNVMYVNPSICKGVIFRRGIHDLPSSAVAGAYTNTVPLPTDTFGLNEVTGNVTVPSTAYASGTSGPPASEWGVKSTGSSVDWYKLGQLNVHDVTAGKDGTAFTGDITIPANSTTTLHVIGGMIVGVN